MTDLTSIEQAPHAGRRRELSDAEVEQIGTVRAQADGVGELVAELRALGDAVDQRWVSIGATQLQQGFMALNRAIAKPEGF